MLKPIDTSNLFVKNANGNGLSNADYERHMRNFQEASRKHRYALHHVDNDFDLMEALYEEALLEYPKRLFDKDFYAERLQVAKNPEYTDKCLKSPAFEDLWDDIRHCNWNVTYDYMIGIRNCRVYIRNGSISILVILVFLMLYIFVY